MYVGKTKALFCFFVFAYGKNRFSHVKHYLNIILRILNAVTIYNLPMKNYDTFLIFA